MTIGFCVPRGPISVNQAYGRNPHRGIKGLYMTAAGKAYKDAVRAHAFAAAKKSGWPRSGTVTCCTLEITTYNTRHDAGSAEKLTTDALQGIIFANDRVVRSVRCSKAKDGGGARVEIIVTLETDKQ